MKPEINDAYEYLYKYLYYFYNDHSILAGGNYTKYHIAQTTNTIERSHNLRSDAKCFLLINSIFPTNPIFTTDNFPDNAIETASKKSNEHEISGNDILRAITLLLEKSPPHTDHSSLHPTQFYKGKSFSPTILAPHLQPDAELFLLINFYLMIHVPLKISEQHIPKNNDSILHERLFHERLFLELLLHEHLLHEHLLHEHLLREITSREIISEDIKTITNQANELISENKKEISSSDIIRVSTSLLNEERLASSRNAIWG